ALRQQDRLETRQRGRRRALAHIGPDQAVALEHLVALGLDLLRKGVVRRHVRHVEAIAVDVELPAVIGAAQPLVLVAAEEQRGAAVRAAVIEDADPAGAVAKGHELLAEQKEPHRVAARLELARLRGGNPVFAHHVADQRPGTDPGQDFTLGSPRHGFLPDMIRLAVMAYAAVLQLMLRSVNGPSCSPDGVVARLPRDHETGAGLANLHRCSRIAPIARQDARTRLWHAPTKGRSRPRLQPK